MYIFFAQGLTVLCMTPTGFLRSWFPLVPVHHWTALLLYPLHDHGVATWVKSKEQTVHAPKRIGNANTLQKFNWRNVLFIAKINILVGLSTYVFISGVVDYGEVKQTRDRIWLRCRAKNELFPLQIWCFAENKFGLLPDSTKMGERARAREPSLRTTGLNGSAMLQT